MEQKSNIIIYTTEDGLTKIETTFDEDTVWLSIDQMAELFQRDKSTISRHIKNVFSEGELVRENYATPVAHYLIPLLRHLQSNTITSPHQKFCSFLTYLVVQ